MTTNRFTTFFAEPFSGEFIAKSADYQINFHLKRHHKYTKTLTSTDINQDICNPVLVNRFFHRTATLKRPCFNRPVRPPLTRRPVTPDHSQLITWF